MAVTITPLAGGTNAKRWLITWALVGDTDATIPHGLPVAPDHIEFIDRNVQAKHGLVFLNSYDTTNVVLTKTNDLNTAGAQVELIVWIPGKL